jgi:transposase
MLADAYWSGAMRTVLLGELLMILDLHRQGLSITAIARRTGLDQKTVRKYIARGLEPPAYGPRQAGHPSKLAPRLVYLRERVAAVPDLSAVRLTRELLERGYGETRAGPDQPEAQASSS